MNSVNKSTKNGILIFQYPPKYPKTVHLYITNECNLNCEKCHYRSAFDNKHQISFNKIKAMFEEWNEIGLTSIAIGGGEPLLHPNIIDIVELAKEMKFFIAITTNGTILKSIQPDRIHISYDELHPTWRNETLIQKTINFYKNRGCVVGINHILTNLENIDYIENTLKHFDTILFIREKPKSNFTKWAEIPIKKNYWIEGCIEGKPCEQGILSFHIDYRLNSSICSNFKMKIPYTSLEDTWNKLKEFQCNIRDSPISQPNISN